LSHLVKLDQSLVIINGVYLLIGERLC